MFGCLETLANCKKIDSAKILEPAVQFVLKCPKDLLSSICPKDQLPLISLQRVRNRSFVPFTGLFT